MFSHMRYKKYISFKFQPKSLGDGTEPPALSARVVINASDVSPGTLAGLQGEWIDILIREGYAKDPDQIRLYNIGIIE